MVSTLISGKALRIPTLPLPPSATTQEAVYLRLRNAIMVGAVAPGTPLTMRGLAEALEVSPTPIRESMRRLSSDRAVTETSTRRFMIPHMDPGRFADLIATRTVLESHAASRALPYVSDVAIAHLVQIDQQMDAAMDREDYDDLTRLNHAFHRALYQLNPHHAVLPLIESTWLQLGPFQRQVISSVRDFYKVDRHKEILAALDTRNDADLREAIAQDVQDGIARAGTAALAQDSEAPSSSLLQGHPYDVAL